MRTAPGEAEGGPTRLGRPGPPRARDGRYRGPAGVARERRLARSGYRGVAGLDEAGRGSWAGPLVAAAVVLPPISPTLLRRLRGLRDSKQLSPPQRDRLAEAVRGCAVAVGVGLVGAALLDALGLSAAGRLAMERAVRVLGASPDFLLIDAFPLPAVHCPQEAVIHGDALCLTIAAASVIAKVERDRLMDVLGGGYPGYGLERNKGYGTADHARALRTLGPTPEHRRSYAPLRSLLDRPGLP